MTRSDGPRLHAGRRRASIPLSEPETRAVFLFLMTHPNVGLAQSLDTAVPMILRGPSTERDRGGDVPGGRWRCYKKFDKKGLEITGYPWAGDTYHVYATGAAVGGVNPGAPVEARGATRPSSGTAPTSATSTTACIWYGDEIWNGGRFADYDKDGTHRRVEIA